MTKIDSGVPMPERSEIVRTLREMRGGDSITLTMEQRDIYYITARRHAIRVSIRKVDGGGFRLWKMP